MNYNRIICVERIVRAENETSICQRKEVCENSAKEEGRIMKSNKREAGMNVLWNGCGK